METIEIALAANAPYFCGMLVTACSIAEYAASSVCLRFHILDGGIEAEDYELLQQKVTNLHKDVVFHRIAVDEADFSDCPSWNGSRMIYTRLMLPKWLPEQDWVIYCDVDFLWMRDVAQLWRERDEKVAFIGVLDPASATRESDEAWCAERGLRCPSEEYCCAGLSFLNLKMFREEGLFDRVMKLNQLHPPYNDQTLFNVVTQGRKKLVGEEWQCFTEKLSQELLDKGVVIHHAGEIPWKGTPPAKGVKFLSDTMLLWHQANARYLGMGELSSLRRHFSFGWIVIHRLMTLTVRLPLVTALARCVCDMVGHPGVWTNVEFRIRKLRKKRTPV